ncbi:hypothetical protein AB1Y20_018455 [Prymnesium parvum]|uniref:tRNA (guanine(37)-N1)-methyltransferase n=1 Tax=Prymnesium parvum TaxID=97485 RepID=A0AB34JNR0_PRYPA
MWRVLGVACLHRSAVAFSSAAASSHRRGALAPLTPAVALRGVSVLVDRSSFRSTLSFLGVSVETSRINTLRKSLGAYALQHRRIKGVQPDRRDSGRRVLLLNVTEENLPAAARLAVRRAGGELQQVEVELTYDDLTATQVLQKLLPSGVDVPAGFEMAGHLVHLNLQPEQLPYKALIGQVLLDKLRPRVQTVVNKLHEIDSPFRVLPFEVIAGERRFDVEVQHGAATMRFDYSRVYWNSKLHSEHERLVSSFARGALVWDLFAGVGPFAVLAARRGVHVLANDLNPDCTTALLHNAKLNRVAPRIAVYNLDAADFVQRALNSILGEPPACSLSSVRLAYSCRSSDEAETLAVSASKMEARPPSHVIMNFPGDAIRFTAAFRRLKSEPARFRALQAPIVHCYTFSRCSTAQTQLDEANQLLLEHLGWVPEVEIREVRSVAPGKAMLCYSFALTSTAQSGQIK